MFIISFKFNKRKAFMTLVILLIAAVVAVAGIYIISRRTDEKPVDLNAQIEQRENANAVKFIEGFGWRVDPKPVETEEFTLPQQFDTLYKRYNQYQKDIGLDLTPYMGKQVKRNTFKVLNYKVPEKYKGQQVYADTIIYDGKVIAGDLKTNQLNGFMVSMKGRTFKEITGIDEWMFK